LPPRRGRNPSQEPDNAGAVDYPKRGKPFREQVPPDDGGGDLPPRRGPSSAKAAPAPAGDTQQRAMAAPASAPPSNSARAAATASDATPTESDPVATVFKTGTQAAELEVILKMVERMITPSKFTAAELATIGSLISTMAENVSRLAKQEKNSGSGDANED